MFSSQIQVSRSLARDHHTSFDTLMGDVDTLFTGPASDPLLRLLNHGHPLSHRTRLRRNAELAILFDVMLRANSAVVDWKKMKHQLRSNTEQVFRTPVSTEHSPVFFWRRWPLFKFQR